MSACPVPSSCTRENSGFMSAVRSVFRFLQDKSGKQQQLDAERSAGLARAGGSASRDRRSLRRAWHEDVRRRRHGRQFELFRFWTITSYE